MKYTNFLASFTILTYSLISGEVIKGQYIIGFDKHARFTFDSQVESVTDLFTSRDTFNKILNKFDSVFYGISANLDERTLSKVKKLPNIKSIEENQVTKVYSIQEGAPWGLARISQREKLGPAPYTFNYDDKAGEGVNVYVIDTGVLHSHQEFEGRASFGANFIENSPNTDEQGHGTHCAGTVAGKTYGVAKKSRIISVKVLDKFGRGSTELTIAGINWVANNINGTLGNVISMSMGSPYSEAVNNASKDAVNKGIVFVAASGNDAHDACLNSPGSTPEVITVGASGKNDRAFYYSNHGPCIDILAPGIDIKSAYIESDESTAELIGTSQACPHVAGLAATLISHGVPVNQVDSKLKEFATKDKLHRIKEGTPNLLAYNGFKYDNSTIL